MMSALSRLAPRFLSYTPVLAQKNNKKGCRKTRHSVHNLLFTKHYWVVGLFSGR